MQLWKSGPSGPRQSDAAVEERPFRAASATIKHERASARWSSEALAPPRQWMARPGRIFAA